MEADIDRRRQTCICGRLVIATGGMSPADCSDEDLMRGFCRTLDDDVFHALADRYYERAVRFAGNQLGNSTTAYDAVQEAFVRVVRHRKRYDPGKPFAPWFFTILRNVCTDFKRKEARRLDALHRFTDLVRWPRENGAARDRVGALLECVDDDDVRLLRLRYVQGMSVAEIAGNIGCSFEAAKKRMQRVILRLRSIRTGTDGT